MAHLQNVELSWRSELRTINTWKIPFRITSTLMNRRTRFKKSGQVHCCTTSSASSSDQQLDLKLHANGLYENKKALSGYLVSDTNWRVRKMMENEEEMRSVAEVQAEAFHEPVFLFDDLFFNFFKVIIIKNLEPVTGSSVKAHQAQV